MGRNFSNNYKQMGETAKKWYNDKLDRIALEVDDPVPSIEFPDIYNFLINTPSPFTKEELKAYKSLNGYKYQVAGWVGDLSVHPVAMHDEKLVLNASVRHSQSVSASHLKPWVAAEKCGTIICHLYTLYMYGGAWSQHCMIACFLST